VKSFVYGRPAVEKGDRGYRVFVHEGLEPEEVKRIKDLFSDEDPDVRELDTTHFEPFYVYFPWRDGAWIFGKGKIETAGRLGAMYYSYLFHGVVLDADARAELRDNPFVLADFFDLDAAKRTRPPHPPKHVEEKGLLLNLVAKAKALRGREHGAGEAGALVAELLSSPAGPMTVPHRGDWDAAFWGCVYFLLPPPVRRELSLATWGPFLAAECRLRGGVGEGRALEVRAGGRGVFTDLLDRLVEVGEDPEAARALMALYESAGREIRARELRGAELVDFLEKLFRAAERPSVRALELWPEVGAALLPHKLDHLTRIWAVNRGEGFPDLAERIWQVAIADYGRTSDKLAAAFAEPVTDLYGALADELGARAAADVISYPHLAKRCVERMSPETLIGALMHAEPDGQVRGVLLTRVVGSGLAGGDVFTELVRIALGKLRLAREDVERRRWADMLEQLADLDGARFDALIAPWIFAGVELPFGLMPRVGQRCFEVWSQAIAEADQRPQTGDLEASGRVELARMRLSLMARRHRGLVDPETLTEPSVFLPDLFEERA